jgi:hypothetical protein
MNSILKSFILVTIIAITTNAQTFDQLLNQTNMQFSIPPDFVEVPIINNADVSYDFAIKSNTAALEVRFRIWPIDRKQKNPNAIYHAMLVTMGLNISNGQMIKSQQYPAQSVKAEFGADAGSSGVVPIGSEFGKGYRFCLISVIHKDNVADAYVFYLYNDQRTIMGALTTDNIYHALTFQ